MLKFSRSIGDQHGESPVRPEHPHSCRNLCHGARALPRSARAGKGGSARGVRAGRPINGGAGANLPRGRPPIYPYYYAPRRGPGGWSFYFGPVPYEKGDYETQALQRLYPQLNYPPSMRYWTPQSGF